MTLPSVGQEEDDDNLSIEESNCPSQFPCVYHITFAVSRVATAFAIDRLFFFIRKKPLLGQLALSQ
jgi:hypothetical protein